MPDTAPEWIGTLTDEALKNEPSLKDFKSVDDLAKSFISTKALVGKKGIILPAEGADEKEWGVVFDSIGRPKTPDDYKMPNVQLKNGMQMNEAEIKEFRAIAHQKGLTQKQFQDVIAYRLNKQMKDFEAAETKAVELKKSTETALRQKWGANYDERISGINKLLKQFGGENGESFVKKFGVDSDAIALLGEILPHLSEATIGNLGIVKGGSLTPEEAKAEIAKIRADEKHPHNIQNHPGHQKAVEDMNRLYAQAYPGKKTI
jgi:hypothetical protein